MNNICDCFKKVPRIPRGNDFKFLLHLVESIVVGFHQVEEREVQGMVNVESVKLYNPNGVVETITQDSASNGTNTYSFNDNTIMLCFYNNANLPVGKYGIEVIFTVTNDGITLDRRFYAPPGYGFYIVESTPEGFIPSDKVMTYEIASNLGLGTLVDLSGYPTNQQLIDGLDGKVDKVEGKGLSTNDFSNEYKEKVDSSPMSVGYFTCETNASTAAKAVTASGYKLQNGGAIKIYMTNGNTASSPTLNINATGAKPIYYNGAIASPTNSWEAGEVIEVYYDGTNYQATNFQGGGGNADKIKYDNTQSGMEATNAQAAIDELKAMIGEGEDTLLNIKKGSFNAAWIYSQANNTNNFMWILYDTVNGTTIQKPIFHIGNGAFIDCIGAVVNLTETSPSQPVLDILNGSEVSRNTPLNVTFQAGSILHYTVDGIEKTATESPFTYHISDALTFECWAVNSVGSSTHAVGVYTIKQVAAPIFSIDDDEVVPFGSIVTISAPNGSILYYKINNEENWNTSNSPVPITINDDMSITAKVYDGVEYSEPITKNYTTATPNAPQFSESGNTVDFGTDLNITFNGGTLYYTVNNGTEQSHETSPLTLKIKDTTSISAYVRAGSKTSSTVPKTYTLNQKKIKVTVSAPTTMTITDSSNVAHSETLIAGANNILLSNIDANGQIKAFSFDTIANVTAIDFGGAEFKGTTLNCKNATNLTSFKGLVMNGVTFGNTADDFTFEGCSNLTTLDFSDVISATLTGTKASFKGCSKLVEIDISKFTYSNGSLGQFFANCSSLNTIIIGAFGPFTYISQTFLGTEHITKLICTKTTPPTVGNKDWIALLVNKSTDVGIYVPKGYVNTYKTTNGWNAYEDRIQEVE